MLKALYDYAVLRELALPPGFVLKPIKAYICLAASGRFLGLELSDEKSVPCPDIGSLANGTEKCNPLAEKRSLILPKSSNAKSTFFYETLAAGAAHEPMLAVCLHAMEEDAQREAIDAEAETLKLKPGDRLSFKVSGRSILGSAAMQAWWLEYRRQFQNAAPARLAPCLITGELTTPMPTLPPISGLSVVGGHARGDSLISFDKPAFCSYGFKQGENAPVSEEAFAAVKAALDHLLDGAPVLAGMKFVHWYDRPLPVEQDALHSPEFGFAIEAADEDDAEETATAGAAGYDAEMAASARKQASKLVSSVQDGEAAQALVNEYFIILLSGAGGRVMVRRYMRGSYAELYQSIRQWREDLALKNAAGTANVPPQKLNAMLIRLLTKQNSDKDIFKRMGRELSGIAPAVMTAILTGGPLPDAVAARALAYIRSQMLDSDEKSKAPQMPDAMACQWLKAWLLRRERNNGQEETIMAEYNPNHASPAYHCGALLALYAAIQKEAMPDVNVGVIQRYYAAACQAPLMAIGQLQRLSTHHLAKIENPAIVRRYEKLLNLVYEALGEQIPTTLNLAQQSYFALGYRQFCVKLENDKINAWAAKKQRNADQAQTEENDKGE